MIVTRILFIYFYLRVNADVLCPFNSDCTCSGNQSEITDYQYAVCRPSQPNFPTFTAPHDATYSIHDYLELTNNVDHIPPRAFVAFKSIQNLILEQSPTPRPPKAQWDYLAFHDVNIQAISISRLAGVIPPPSELVYLGDQGLEELRIYECGESVHLTDNMFSDFTNLKTLEIASTQINGIDASAFAGLEKNLVYLGLPSTNLITYPRDAIDRLIKLTVLDLSENGMNNFPQGAFAPLPELSNLALSGNDLNAAIDARAFDNLPGSVKTLYMDNGGLNSIPTDVLQQGTITVVSMARNEIQSIRVHDFTPGNTLTHLTLSDNPINNIEQDAFVQLNDLFSLLMGDTQLKSFDLSILKGMNNLAYLGLINSTVLSTVTVTNADQVPSKLSHIDLMQSGISHIDPDLEQIVSRQTFKLLDISENTYITCDENAQWLARYVNCDPIRVRITDTTCSDGKSLIDYLNQTVPDPCHAEPTETSQPSSAITSEPSSIDTTIEVSTTITYSITLCTGTDSTEATTTTTKLATSTTANAFVIFITISALMIN